MKNSKIVAVLVAVMGGSSTSVLATNGMNMEGFGPEAAGMGGASLAYDNGSAAMMNNPASLALMEQGSRLDLAVGHLGPRVDSRMGAMVWDSSANSFFMPAVGWVRKDGVVSYGFGAFAQGGMGTDYYHGGPGTGGVMAILGDPGQVAGWRERSSLGVMRLLIPLAWEVNDRFNVGGSIDYVRAGLDLQMALPADLMGDMMMNPQSTLGSIGGSLIPNGLMPMIGGDPNNLRGGYFDFHDDKQYSNQASGDGFGMKLGFTWQASDAVTLGGVWQSKTALSDMTGAASMQVAFDNGGEQVATVPGEIRIHDFQWPQTIGLGLAWQADERLLVAADLMRIGWKDVMKDFRMSFTSGGETLDATLYQNWRNQSVLRIGAAYQLNDRFTVRGGANLARNPVPESTVNYLFPAIVTNHYTAGLGVALSEASSLDLSLTHAPKSKTSSDMGLDISHGQTNWQLMYSHRF